MRPAQTRVVFVPLAQNQTLFYLGVGSVLREEGIECRYLSFHEPSLHHVTAARFRADSVFQHARHIASYTITEALANMTAAGIVDPSVIISHERAAYETSDGGLLLRKLASYLDAMQYLLAESRAEGRQVHVVHELGGFLSVAATFYAARRLGLTNTFIEPSFFRGRVFFTENSYAAPRPSAPQREPVAEVQSHVNRILMDKEIVIPVKDAAHYRSALRKVLSRSNARRLAEKIVDKYVRREREEFDHLAAHVRRHVRMLVNAQRLRPYYCELPTEPFVYYPLHVPADVALTIRAPEYCDQYALLDFLARTIPSSHLLVTKEHPALVGAVHYDRVIDLLRRYNNVVLLRPTLNNHDVLSAADVVVTVNSKSGAEGLLRGRRVVVLGDAFYRDCGLVWPVRDIRSAPAAIRDALKGPTPTARDVARFFQQIWDSSWPGELYVNEPENCRRFADSLLCAVLREDVNASAAL